jgi:hypothetical protein
MEGLVTLLRSPSCYSLQELRLNNTGCGVTGGRLLAKTLLECYHASAAVGHPLALRVFVLGRSRQENEGAKALGKFVFVRIVSEDLYACLNVSSFMVVTRVSIFKLECLLISSLTAFLKSVLRIRVQDPVLLDPWIPRIRDLG